ncbi:hypothetical protein LOTGIDRAFT_163085 [Lottia gigantea]|uniref:Uncharacterized protein n=1 Tax=Lottia gigantea TaxID=225164 RepID=V4BSQ4_LOTGI|nr:hypothetical protein LOTGIDRAFT_163085 [Lottia gigantea]ESO92079.1 hypothetical protein LOTGIDRAFT_163085 [Lottia gigantea]
MAYLQFWAQCLIHSHWVNGFKNNFQISHCGDSKIFVILSSLIVILFNAASKSNQLPAKDSSEDCDDVIDAIEELYKDLCTVSCYRKDYYCNLVVQRYIKPLCVYRNAQKAAKALLAKIGCKQMSYRKKLICKTKSKKACELAEEVADFCEAADQDCDKKPAAPNAVAPTGRKTAAKPTAPAAPAAPTAPSAPAAPTAPAAPAAPVAPAAPTAPVAPAAPTAPVAPAAPTTPATTTTTESKTTLNPGPLASDFKCDSFYGKCYLAGCPSHLSVIDACETSGYTCCEYSLNNKLQFLRNEATKTGSRREHTCRRF